MSGNIIYTAVIGLCAGISSAFLLGFGSWVALGCIVLAIALLFFKNPKLLLVATALAAVAFGIVHAEWQLYRESQETVTNYFQHYVTIEGKIFDDPDVRSSYMGITVDVFSIQHLEARGKILAQIPIDSNVSFGDRVEVKGAIEAPENFETQGGREFDYENYLRARGISGIVPKAQVTIIEPVGFSVRGSLFALKHVFEHAVENIFSSNHAALLEGELLGERRGLPKELTNAFISSSLIHVVVLSGTNISIISEAIMRSLSFLPQGIGLSFGSVSIILFALMTGGGATTVRALIMGLIGLLARYLHRPNAAMRALALAGAVLVLWNPLSILYDTSFILSFLATFGLITLSPFVEKHLTKIRILRKESLEGVRSIAATTIAVQIFILPALLYFTGVLSFLALPANLLALPTVPASMLFGFIAGLFGMIHPFLAVIPAAIANIFLWWMIFIAQTVSSIPLSSIIVPAFPAWVAIIAYIPLFIGAIMVYQDSV